MIHKTLSKVYEREFFTTISSITYFSLLMDTHVYIEENIRSYLKKKKVHEGNFRKISQIIF